MCFGIDGTKVSNLIIVERSLQSLRCGLLAALEICDFEGNGNSGVSEEN